MSDDTKRLSHITQYASIEPMQHNGRAAAIQCIVWSLISQENAQGKFFRVIIQIQILSLIAENAAKIPQTQR